MTCEGSTTLELLFLQSGPRPGRAGSRGRPCPPPPPPTDVSFLLAASDQQADGVSGSRVSGPEEESRGEAAGTLKRQQLVGDSGYMMVGGEGGG